MSVWLLPENIADMLPREARTIETLRQKFFKLVASHGFEQIRPPLIEYTDSLQVGTGEDLDLRTFKVVDQISGRLIGIRADMTPQIARIDAHILNRSGISRLSYAGSVLHARPLHPMASRQPYVSGVELFGSKSREADLEVISLGVEALKRFNLGKINLDLGHVGVVKAILAGENLSSEATQKVLYALTHKDVSGINEMASSLSPKAVSSLLRLVRVFGNFEALTELKRALAEYPKALSALEETEWLALRSNADSVSFDFADVHGYGYLTGVTFSVTVPKRFQAILRGGRYDDIGAKFGRMRPAVGFTLYLREIANLIEGHRPKAVLAPLIPEDELLQMKIRELRENGEIVIVRLEEDEEDSLRESFHLNEELVFENGVWMKVPHLNTSLIEKED